MSKKSSLEKVNEWMNTGGPPYLNDEELMDGISHLRYCADILHRFDAYRMASSCIYRDLNAMEMIARARNLM